MAAAIPMMMVGGALVAKSQKCAEVLLGRANQKRVILIVHSRLNPIALPEVSHY